MRKKTMGLVAALSVAVTTLTGCPGQNVPTSQVLNPPVGTIIKAGERLYNVGASEVKEVGASSSPSTSLSASNLQIDPDRTSAKVTFDGSGIKEFDVYRDNTKVETRPGSERSYTLSNLSENTVYTVKLVFRGDNGGTAELSKSFTTDNGSSGSDEFNTSQLIGTNWEIVNFSGVTSLLKKSEWLDNSTSNPRFQFNLKEAVSYHYRLTDASGRVAEGDWNNSVVVLENLGSATAPIDFIITAKSGPYNNTQILAGRIKRR